MQKYLEEAGVDFRFNTEVTNVIFEFEDGKKIAKAIECKVKGMESGIVLTKNDLIFVTNGSCTEGTIYGDQNHAPNGDAEVRTSTVKLMDGKSPLEIELPGPLNALKKPLLRFVKK